jgi:polyphosphate kinase
VRIDLIIRGICCLRPGIAGVSENITVRSIVGRFLEHSRIFYFENGGQPKMYLGSADWMPRNFFRRIEIVFPIEDAALRKRLVEQILAVHLADNTKASLLDAEAVYARPAPLKPNEQRNSQAEFMAFVLGEASLRKKGRSAPTRYPKIEVASGPKL